MTVKKKIKEKDINFDNNSLYFGYKSRVSVLIILFAVLAIILFLLITKFINSKEIDYVKYDESGNIKYENIVNNDVSKEIDKIKLNFNYKMKYDKNIVGSYKIKIKAKTYIYDSDYNELYTKVEELYSEKISERTLNQITIDKKVDIDYKKYNDKAKEYNEKYENSSSKMDVSLVVESDISPQKFEEKKSLDSFLLTTISLGKNSIEYTFDPVDNSGTISFEHNNISIYSVILEVLIIIIIITIIIVFIKLNKLLSKLQPRETNYDKELKRILNKYDKIIVNVSIMPDETKYKKESLKEFDELIEIKNNTHKPIRYYEVVPHQKSYFFIKDKGIVYIYTMKNID